MKLKPIALAAACVVAATLPAHADPGTIIAGFTAGFAAIGSAATSLAAAFPALLYVLPSGGFAAVGRRMIDSTRHR